jgi:hypothetical protein
VRIQPPAWGCLVCQTFALPCWVCLKASPWEGAATGEVLVSGDGFEDRGGWWVVMPGTINWSLPLVIRILVTGLAPWQP